MNDLYDDKILPVAIMAHNEEKLIDKSIKSCFKQICPKGFNIFVIVVANGCTDGTENKVSDLTNRYGNNLKLLSMTAKGKTIALNRSIAYILNEMVSKHEAPFVIFMDADCELVGNNVFVNFVNRFSEIPSLCAVGATNAPLIVRRNIVSSMYYATNELNKLLPENGISGGAYCVRSPILSKIHFPESQIADDMYISLKLDGWMFRDKSINVLYEIPASLFLEIKKRIRQEIATQRFIEISRQQNVRALHQKPLDDQYRWTGYTNLDVIKNIFFVRGLKNQLLIILSIGIRLLSKIIARIKLLQISNNTELDYWQIER